MGLKLNELQKVVKNVVKNERNIDALREEIVRALGHTILVSRGLEKMAESANERLDILEATGKSYGKIRPALLLKFIDSSSPEVRKLVARLLPESFLKHLMKDSSPTVRAAVTNRLPTRLVHEMTRRFPKDDTLRQILKSRKLLEAGLPTPEIEDEEFDMYGNEAISNAFSDLDYPELTDAWYDTLANKIVNMYGRNIEEQWEESTVHQYTDSMRSMGVTIDRQRLLDAVYDILKRRQDSALDENLKSIAAKLRLEATIVMPTISESIDSVKRLIESKNSSSDYIAKFEELFFVEYGTSKNPTAFVMAESLSLVTHPTSARLSKQISSAHEKATDMYVDAWNSKNKIKGENYYQLAWTLGNANGLVNFHLELK